MVGDPKGGIQHHSSGRSAGHQTDGELWIVAGDGAHADHHRVAGGPKGVGQPTLLPSADPLGIAGRGGDPSVQGLRVLDRHEGPPAFGANMAQERRGVERLVRRFVLPADLQAVRREMSHAPLFRSEVAKVAQVRGHWERHDTLHLDSSRPKGLDLGRAERLFEHAGFV